MVRLREDGWLDGDGAAEVQLFTVICGRPPAHAAVIPIRTVRAATWLDDSVNRTVVGLLTSLN